MKRVMEIDAEINMLPPTEFKHNVPTPLVCKAYCTAESYDFSALKEPSPDEESSDLLHYDIPEGGDAYVFTNGTCVTWSAQDVESFVHETLGPARVKPIGHVPIQTATFDYEQDEPTCLKGSLILLNPNFSPHLAKIAFSYGMARSVKLASLENMFDLYWEHHAQSLKPSRKDLQTASDDLAQIRQLMLANAQDGFLDTPELQWTRPELQEYYTSISTKLDVRPRITILNKKMDLADAQIVNLRHCLAEKNARTLHWLVLLMLASVVGGKVVYVTMEQRKAAAALSVAQAQVEDDYSVHAPTVVT
ncbi:hypothetical protein BJV82DRAFT_577335 [Fennellomyces sp. T-0311]|nr:hypothetical protein BJV82DRAFT_577335 [Fennellomyces sp. T-0311]